MNYPVGVMITDTTERIKLFDQSAGDIIPVLQMIQNEYFYLSKDAKKFVADHMGATTSDVYDVATFYKQFRCNLPGKH